MALDSPLHLIEALRRGQPVVLVDGEDDEGDGMLLQAAEFIDDHGELGFGGAEAGDKAVERLKFGCVLHRAEQLADVEPGLLFRRSQQRFLGVDQAEQVFDAAVIDGEFGEVGLAEKFEELIGRILHVETDHVDARGHDVFDVDVRDADDFLQQFVF